MRIAQTKVLLEAIVKRGALSQLALLTTGGGNSVCFKELEEEARMEYSVPKEKIDEVVFSTMWREGEGGAEEDG